MPPKEKKGDRNEATLLSIDFMDSARLFSLHGRAKGSQIVKEYRQIVVSGVAEHGGTGLKLLDDSATALYGDPNEAVKSAIGIKIRQRRYSSAAAGGPGLRFKISIIRIDGCEENGEVRGRDIDVLKRIAGLTGRSDRVFVSDDIRAVVEGNRDFDYRHVGAVKDNASRDLGIYEVVWKDNSNLEAHEGILKSQFQYRYALIEGIHDPCFFCGSRGHLVLDCPSQHLPESTHASSRLRYLSVKQTNALFSEALARGFDEVHHESERNSEGVPEAFFTAYYGFYDLKRVYQPRFFRVITSYAGDDWCKAKKAAVRNESGNIWIAQDCLRTGDLERAESLLRPLCEEHPDDFKTSLAMGYLEIAKGRYTKAADGFRVALKNANTNPRRILSLLLTSRIYYLYTNDLDAAEQQIRLIRRIERDCPDAEYQDIMIDLRSEKDSRAAQRLLSLIRRYPEYYLAALIDPELANWQMKINEELRLLLAKAAAEAGAAVSDAENRLTGLAAWLGDDPRVHDLTGRLAGTKETYSSGSYLGYADANQRLVSMVFDCARLESESREEMRGLVRDLRDQVHQLSRYFKGCIHMRLAGKGLEALDHLGNEVEALQKEINSSLPYKEALIRHASLSERLPEVHRIVDRIERRKMVNSVLMGLSKRAFITFLLTTFGGFVLVPVIIHFVWASWGVDILHSSNIMEYTSTILVVSGIISTFTALFGEYHKVLKSNSIHH